MSEILEELFSSGDLPQNDHHISGQSDGKLDLIAVRSPYTNETRVQPARQAKAMHRGHKMEQIQPFNNTPSAFAGSSSSYLQYTLTNQGPVEELLLEWISTVDNASGGSVTCSRLPAPLAIHKIELLLNGVDVAETISGATLLHEGGLLSNTHTSFAERQEQQMDDAPITIADGASSPAVVSRVRLYSMLNSVKICPRALRHDSIIRVFYAPRNHTSASAGVTGTLSGCKLWCTHTELSHSEQNKLTAQLNSEQGIHYRVLRRAQATHPVSNVATGTQYTQLNSTCQASVAAVVMWWQAQDQSGEEPTTFYPITQARVLDSQGRTRHTTKDDALMRLWVGGAGIGAKFAYTATQPIYVFPSSSSFLEDVATGTAHGLDREDTRTKYEWTASAAMNGLNLSVNFVNYQFATLRCSGGVLTVENS